MRQAERDETLPSDAGLTVLELMIVLVILSLIGTVVSIQVFQQFDRAKVDIAGLQLRQIQSALLLYQVDVHGLPDTDTGLAALVTNTANAPGWRGPYLKNSTALLDPWGQAIGYEMTGPSDYMLRSKGADKLDGGDGAGMDIRLAASE